MEVRLLLFFTISLHDTFEGQLPLGCRCLCRSVNHPKTNDGTGKDNLSECEWGSDSGTGLGLAIAHNIARSHSRLLQLTDNTAARVRFTLTLARSGDRGGHNESVNVLWAEF
jgi:hypothetical protein